MSWLRRKIYKWLQKEDREDATEACSPYPITSLKRTSDVSTDEGLNMNIFRATSGYVIKFDRYDRLKDRTYQKLYIVNDDDDFDERIGSMIKMEMLKLPQQ